jgi:LysM repeat protein
MKHLAFLFILLSLPAMACQITANGDATNQPQATDVLVKPTSIIDASSTTAAEATPAPDDDTADEDGETTAEATTSPAPSVAATEEATVPPETTSEPAEAGPTPTPCPVRVEWPEYVVQSGDTLFRIAQLAGSSVDELVEANCLSNRDIIPVGMLLRVPPGLVSVFPTTIPDGDNLVIYLDEDCFSAPFYRDAGVSVAERWRVSTQLDVLTVYDGQNSNAPSGLLDRGEHFLVNEGPVCYTKNVAGGQHAFRRWRVTSEDRPLSGWIDEYDVFTEVTSIESRPVVVEFDVSPRVINTGDPITIEWEVRGANDVHIFSYHSLQRFASGRVSEEPFLPPSGSITVYAPEVLTSIRYSLGFSPADPDHWATVQINCAEPFFADPGDLQACPAGPVETITVAYQPFEHGFMIWRPDLASQTIWIYLEDSPGGHVFIDEWDGETITFDEDPPDGLVQPVRGFGKVWVENEWVRQSLGWGTADEVGYEMELQQTQTAYNAYYHFHSLPDGRLVKAGQFMGTSLNWEYTTRR